MFTLHWLQNSSKVQALSKINLKSLQNMLTLVTFQTVSIKYFLILTLCLQGSSADNLNARNLDPDQAYIADKTVLIWIQTV